MSDPDDLGFAEEPGPQQPLEPSPPVDPFPNTPDPPRQQGESQKVVKPKKSGCGKCCLFGCLGMGALAVAGAIGLWLALPYVLAKAVEVYTDAEPAAVPEVEVSQQDLQQIKRRLESFGKAVERHEARTLKLTAHDINALLSEDPELRKGELGLYVTMEDDRITGEISVPIDSLAKKDEERRMIEKLGLQGRYLNGTVTFKVHLRDGQLQVFIDRVTVKGRALPEFILKSWRKHNLADSLLKRNADLRDSLKTIETVEIQDGVLIIQSKAGAETPPEPPPAERR